MEMGSCKWGGGYGISSIPEEVVWFGSRSNGQSSDRGKSQLGIEGHVFAAMGVYILDPPI